MPFFAVLRYKKGGVNIQGAIHPSTFAIRRQPAKRLFKVAVLQQRRLESTIAEALHGSAQAVDILLLIDGDDDALIKDLLLDGGVHLAALGGVDLLSGGIDHSVHLGIAVAEDVVGCIGVEEAVGKVDIAVGGSNAPSVDIEVVLYLQSLCVGSSVQSNDLNVDTDLGQGVGEELTVGLTQSQMANVIAAGEAVGITGLSQQLFSRLYW